MSELVLESEALNGALEGRPPGRDEAAALLAGGAACRRELLRAARAVRDRGRGRTVTFSKKAFVDVTRLCRDECSYCTYRSEPGGPGPAPMDERDVAGLLGMAAGSRCVEALLVTGERPEERYGQARAWLRRNGFSSTPEYLAHCSEMALERGLFPHTNAGCLGSGEMRELARTNASMGLMLESSSERLAGEGMPHGRAPSKAPAERMRALEDAGRLGVPMTTGVLAGIGETPEEMADSLIAIRGLARRFGNVQEVIVQNFRPKPGTPMAGSPAAGGAYHEACVALARVLMPGANIQAPPNLSPGSYARLLGAGINDWGGVSPLTPDHVNPEFGWPAIGRIEADTRAAGFELACRFPVYPEFARMASRRVREAMAAASDGRGLVAGWRWR